MGLGKTVQTAAALCLIQDQLDRVLLIAPNSLCLNWSREMSQWAPSIAHRRLTGDPSSRLATYKLPIRVLIASYEQIRQDYQFIDQQINFDLVIVDEAQRIKNPSSELSLACRVLRRRRSWALTGTPLENRVADLISIFRFLSPSLLRRGMPRQEIHGRIQPHFLRRTKASVLSELPPIIYRDIALELTQPQRDAYDAIWERRYSLACSQQGKISLHNMLATITQLKQICNFDVSTGESSKLEALTLVLESLTAPRDKVLIFSQYLETLQWMSEKVNIPHQVFHGGLSQEERSSIVHQFENRPGPRALLLTYGAGGVGLNLQSASTVIVYDRWWNPAMELQSIQRAHRFGRQRPLYVVRFVVTDTVEERIQEILQQKRGLFEDYIERAKSAAVADDKGATLLRILNIHADGRD